MIYLVQINFNIDVAASCPAFRHLKLMVLHVELDSLSWSIVIPKFKTSLYVLIGSSPVSLDIKLERLSEYWVELLNVLLQSHDVAVQRKHVVNAFVLEALNVDSLILSKLN